MDILLIIGFMKLSKNTIRVLMKGLTPIFFLIFTFFMHIFFYQWGKILFHWGILTIESDGVLEGIYISKTYIYCYDCDNNDIIY